MAICLWILLYVEENAIKTATFSYDKVATSRPKLTPKVTRKLDKTHTHKKYFGGIGELQSSQDLRGQPLKETRC